MSMYTVGAFLLGFLILVGYKFYYGFVINWKREMKASLPKRLFMETVLPAIFLFMGTYFVASLAIRPYMLQHPEILEDTFKALEAKKQVVQKEAASSYLADNKEAMEKLAPVLGNKNGDVTIYEFYDYSCGHCRRVSNTLEELMVKDKNVKVVLKQYPISPFTVTASLAVIASQKQGMDKVAAFHHILMAEGVIPENMSKDMPRDKIEEAFKQRILDLAKKAGLNADQLSKDMMDPSVMEELNQSREAGTELGIEGTPFFIVGTQIFPGALSLEDFEKAIKDAR